MSHLHRLDPAAQHRAAVRAGVLAARGLVEGPPLLAAIRRIARAAAPGCDPSGLAMRLAHRYADAHEATLQARATARRRVLAAVWPLLAGRATRAEILAAAAAADADSALSEEEWAGLAAEAIRRHLQGGRR